MNMLRENMRLIAECSQQLVSLGENLWGKGTTEKDVSFDTESEWLKHEITLPEGYIFKDENGNVINATKIVLEKKKKEVILTQEQIDTMVHESCVLFCKHCGCGIPRETCTSLGSCKDHDEYRKSMRTYFEKHKN